MTTAAKPFTDAGLTVNLLFSEANQAKYQQALQTTAQTVGATNGQ